MVAHAQIAAAVTRIYNLFIELGHLTADQVIFPSSTPNTLDAILYRNHLEDSAINLLLQPPYAQNMGALVEFTPDTRLAAYGEDWSLDAVRYPTYPDSDPEELDFPALPSSCVPLSFNGCELRGAVYVVDAKTGK
jgi:hypothetical protein